MRRSSPRTESNDRSGFTLLEVLLTVLLSMILLGGLWSLSNIYLRTFERGQDLVEQAQLLRAIQQQVSDDLQALAIRPKLTRRHSEFMATEESGVSTEEFDPSDPMETSVTDFSPSYPESNTESGITSLPVYSLSGNETSMKLIILRDVYTTDENKEFEPEIGLPGEMSKSRIPNWRVVQYQFVPRDEDEIPVDPDEAPENIKGLSRREIAWEDLIGSETFEDLLMPAEEIGEFDTTESLGDAGITTPPSVETEEERDALRGKEERIDLQQIIACRFRYFDGTTWQSSWESTSSRELPVAVELVLQIEPTGAAQRARLRREQESISETNVEDEENTVLQEPQLETRGDWPIYREVFFLTNGGKPRHPRRGGPENLPAGDSTDIVQTLGERTSP